MSEEDITSIDRRKASSGKVSYGDAVVLHETSRSRVTLVPFYIPHSDRTELSVKITTYTKREGGWQVKEEKSITLTERASRKLLSALEKQFQVAEVNEDGKYLLLRVSDGSADVRKHDPQMVANALTKVLSQKDILAHLENAELSEELVVSLRSAIRIREMQTAVSELRDSLNRSEVDEIIYQTWCERHSWAFGSAYVVNDLVRNITASDNLDMLLPNVIAGYRDLVELKRPDMKVLNYDSSHRNYYWSSEVSKAIGQCHRYLDVLHEVAATGLRDHPEIVAYHPRAIIVIGRSQDWDDKSLRALHGLNHRITSITVMTYDQLLAQGERLLSIVSPNQPEVEEPKIGWDDDIPF